MYMKISTVSNLVENLLKLMILNDVDNQNEFE